MNINSPKISHRRWKFAGGFLFAITVAAMLATPRPAHAQDNSITLKIKPLTASGMHTTSMGNKIFLFHGGQRVWFEIFYSNWSPLLLRAVYLTIDGNSYSNSEGDSIGPADVFCTMDMACQIELGDGSRCAGASPPNVTGENTCRAGYQTLGRDDGIPNENGGPFTIFGTVPVGTLDFIYANAVISDPPKSDPGFDIYAGTLVLDVPQTAAGRYTIVLTQNSWTFGLATDGMNDNIELSIISFPATIELPSGCCNPEGTCSTEFPTVCESGGGTSVARCAGDCNQNGMNDACEIASGSGSDCNANDILDICEIRSNRSLDCNFSFTLDECDVVEGTSNDCNSNLVPDVCDIHTGAAADCNQNGVPDACDLTSGNSNDCNNNNMPDECEGAFSASGDCNSNSTLDSCDIVEGTSLDIDSNCLPDECDPNPTPQAEPVIISKSRYISFTPQNTGCSTAIRVKLTSLYHPQPGETPRPDISALEGEYRWVGQPDMYTEGLQYKQPDFWAASLQCEPYFADWSTFDLLQVYGPSIVPDSLYEVQLVDGSCADLNDPSCYSDAIEIETGTWCDVIEPFTTTIMGGEPSLIDILAIVDKFQGVVHPVKAHTQLQPAMIDPAKNIDNLEILAAVDAWLGSIYSYDAPTSCNP